MRLVLPESELMMTSDLLPLPTTARLDMSIGQLVSWGNGARIVTAYETMVQRDTRRNVHPTDEPGRRRVVGSYDIDTAALARLAAEIRVVAEGWYATLDDFHNLCEEFDEADDGRIIVT